MSRSRLHQWHGDPPSKRAPVVVGVVHQQSVDLVRRAASLARDMGAGLLCVWVDGSRALVGQDDDGTLLTTGGSVAGRLARTQHRPVTVIPPATRDSA